MTTVLQFAILGLGIGTAYTLLAQGLLLIYRGSGVINFAHGSMAMLSAFIYWQLRTVWDWTLWPALVVTILVMTLLGALTYHLIMRPLGKASNLARVIATLGMFTLLQGVALLIWGPFPKTLESDLPTTLLRLGGVAIGLDKLLMFVIAIVMTAVIWAASRYTPLGLAIRGNAENPRAAATLGWSPHLLGGITWGVGAGLAGLAGILVAPLVGVTVDALPLLVIPVLAAVLVGRLNSFWLTLIGAMAIGILQSLASRYIAFIPGIQQALPFLVIILVLVVRGKGVAATRSAAKQILPTLGSGRIRWSWVLVTFVVLGALVYFVFPTSLAIAISITLSWGIVLLSIVVLLGYTGQLSLAQFALGGVAALVAGRLVYNLGFPFIIASIVALIVVSVVGVLFALPALRSRGIDLAIVTLGLGATVAALVFSNGAFTGGLDGTPVGPQTLFGIDLNTIIYPERWAILVLVVAVLVSIVVANIRRSSTGRRMIAVRTNERAASALGISVLRVKLYAFAMSAVIAGIGGILLAFRNPTILYAEFDPIASIQAVGYAFIGGVGFIVGAPMGGTLASGGFGSWVIDSLFPGASPAWLLTVAGLMIILFALGNPNGLVAGNVHQFHAIVAKIRKNAPAKAARPLERTDERTRVRPAELNVSDLVVKFGGVTAINGANLNVKSGQVVGLIGPNGAGKTTLIDTVTGFVKPAEGRVAFDGEDITGLPVYQRTRAGISRSFQSLELFESSTVRENLSVASDPIKGSSYFTDLVAPKVSPLSPAAVAAVLELDLEQYLDTVISDLPYGTRRLVAIARAIASEPSILLLDEPAAGLSSTETQELAVVIRRLVNEWGIGVLVIEHDMAFVMSLCDEIVVLNFGNQIARGTPAEVSTLR